MPVPADGAIRAWDSLARTCLRPGPEGALVDWMRHTLDRNGYDQVKKV